ncbi:MULTISPECIES: lipopolysaccharide biosynthesis protein [Gammaproteobacteria]|uniref:lipopolysaccharide biosynthesis protein n=1 Tax=Gammaproteobacteria TaxID=1236 RepID=UPI003A8CC0DF
MLNNILKYGFGELLSKLLPFFTILFVANRFSPSELGEYSLYIIYYEIFFILISYNIQATVRVDFFKKNILAVYSISRMHLTASLAVCIFIASFAFIFLGFPDNFFFPLLAVSALLRAFTSFVLAILQCEEKVSQYTFLNIIYIIPVSLGICLLVYMGGKAESWAYSALFASMIQFVVATQLVKFDWKPEVSIKKFREDEIIKHFIFASSFFPQAIGWWLKLAGDRYLISKFIGLEILGQFTLAAQIASPILIAARVLNLATIPRINACYSKGKWEQSSKYLKMLSGTSFIVILLVYLVGCFMLKDIYGGKYTQAGNYFPLICISYIPQTLLLLYVNPLYYFGLSRLVALSTLVSFSMQFVLGLFLVKPFGVIGLIYLSLIINSFLFIFILFQFNKIKSEVLVRENLR